MGKSKFMKPDLTTLQDLSAGALSYTTTFTTAFELEEILFHFDAAVTEIIIITLDSKNGANYDTVLRMINVNNATDARFPSGEKFSAGDNIKVACTNANLTGTCYVTFKASEPS